jgi:hypothetical protein
MTQAIRIKIEAAKNLFEWIVKSLSITPNIHIYRNQKDSIIFSAYGPDTSHLNPYVEVTYWDLEEPTEIQVKILCPVPGLKIAIEDRPNASFLCRHSDDFKQLYNYIFVHHYDEDDE